jgi:tetratricopeptide (TPR) repeat protein
VSKTISEDPDFPGYDADGGDAFDPVFLRGRADQRPADWKGWLRLGYVLVQRSEDGAVTVLKRTTELAPQNGLAHYLLGRAFGHEGQFAECAKEMEVAVGLRPDYAHAWLILGHLRFEKGRIDEALNAFLHTSCFAPDGDVYWSIARCFIAQGRIPAATLALEEAVRLKPNHVPALRALAYLGDYRGEPEVARRHLQQLFALNQHMARAVEDDLTDRRQI